MKKLQYIFKRIIIMLFTLAVVSFLLFIALHVFGTDPLGVIIGEKQNISEEAREELRRQFFLDRPIIEQYFIWLKSVIHGDFGIDYIQKVSVNSLIGGRVAVTVGMVVISLLLSILIAIPLGVISALKKNTVTDSVISFIMLVLTSTPGFMVAMILLVLFTKYIPGYKSIGTYANTVEYLQRIIGPAICLAFGNVALIGRVTRNAMVEQMNADYIATCKAKGISTWQIIRKHALKNSIIPVFTITAMLVGTMVGATVLVEQIFSLPGLGGLLSTACLKNNYPVVMALTLIILIVFQVVNLIADILYTVIDPRIKL